MLRDGDYEVTTYRTESDYKDGRHPDKINFDSTLKEDLSRRDFTINALAYNEKDGVIDYFGGIDDLNNKIIRSVGNPNDRFKEDALRILRALRFSSVLNFKIDEETALAIHNNKELLDTISKERINKELIRLLAGENVLNVLLEYKDIFGYLIPELGRCIGFSQNNKYHCYDVYDHIAHAVANYTGDDEYTNMALLLHDVGKPLCYTEDEKGGHFHGHEAISEELSYGILERMRFSNADIKIIAELIRNHDLRSEPTIKYARKLVSELGKEQCYRLLDIRLADMGAHTPYSQESKIEKREKLKEYIDEVIEQEGRFRLKDLSINGKDLISLGFKEGPIIGKILNKVFDEVINGDIINDKDKIIEYIEKEDFKNEV